MARNACNLAMFGWGGGFDAACGVVVFDPKQLHGA
jgi:hypothetical protein